MTRIFNGLSYSEGVPLEQTQANFRNFICYLEHSGERGDNFPNYRMLALVFGKAIPLR